MIPNDPIEDLFRNEVINNIPLDKPRDIVWKKIAEDLPAKKRAPIKDFVQSVWFAAAIFGLIAIPYLYFFIENLNSQSNINNLNVVQEIVKQQLEIPSNDKSSESSVEKTAEFTKIEEKKIEIVKNSAQKESQKPDLIENELRVMQTSASDFPENYEIRMMPASASINMVLNDSLKSKSNDTLQLALAKNIEEKPNDTILKKDNLTANYAAKQHVAPMQEGKNKLKKYRNKLAYNDKLYKVVFELTSKSPHQLVFNTGDVELKFTKDNNQILMIVNSKEINQEIINELFYRREEIFNYYKK